MIGMVLAAGAGRRLRPYTDSLPKALIPVDGDTTILDIALRNLAAVDLREVVIVVGYAAGEVEERRVEMEGRYGVRLVLVHNDRAEIWNNAYSLWCARDHFSEGVLLVNGDTVHPVAVEETLLAARGPELLLAVDHEKTLAEEEMKIRLGEDGRVVRITKHMDPATAYAEYIGATLIEGSAAQKLTDALQETFERDPQLYYEDAYQHLADQDESIGVAPLPSGTAWVEVDDHVDLQRAREIACLY
ncbi:MAG: phosphocholine cytidylyltransferase family protein [Actinomycetota bacterium]|nr:phosphocholine cytidylyltransferase family protein [Actinomycetota bacterium]